MEDTEDKLVEYKREYTVPEYVAAIENDTLMYAISRLSDYPYILPAIVPYDDLDPIYFKDSTKFIEMPFNGLSVREDLIRAKSPIFTQIRVNRELCKGTLKKDAERPLYFIFLIRGHATALFLYEKKIYSMGFGLEETDASRFISKVPLVGQTLAGVTPKQAILASPDYTVKFSEYTVLYHKKKRVRSEVRKSRLLDAGYLTRSHIERMKSILVPNINENDERSPHKDSFIAFFNSQNEGFYDFIINKSYSYLSLPSVVKCSADFINCSSALSYIFPTLLCNGLFGFSDPTACETLRKKSDFINEIALYLYTIQSDFELDAYESLKGGKKKYSKKSKRNSRSSKRRSRRKSKSPRFVHKF